jgi:hypothetical protein
MIKFCKKCQSDTERNAKGDCKPCAKASNAAYRAANPEKIKARQSAWCALNASRLKAGRSARYAANLEKVRASNAAWYAANPERAKRVNSAWAANNSERIRAAKASWKAANPEKVKAGKARHYSANPGAWRIYNQNRRSRKLENGGNLSQGLSAKLFKLQKGKCPCCNKPLGEDFHLDHVMPLARGGSNTDSNIQLLRASCNLSKSAKDPVQFMQQRGFLI